MFSQRIKALGDLVSANNKVIDIGTDHAYLPIYLVLKRGFKEAFASDVSQKVLVQAEANIAKYKLEDKIHLYLSDGFKNLENTYDTAVIAGMGAETIKKIVTTPNLPPELIIGSNNHLEIIREFFMKLGYKIVKEEIIYEDGKYYDLIKYGKGYEKLSANEIKYGKHHHKKYLQDILTKQKKIYEQSKNAKLLEEIYSLEKFIGKIPD